MFCRLCLFWWLNLCLDLQFCIEKKILEYEIEVCVGLWFVERGVIGSDDCDVGCGGVIGNWDFYVLVFYVVYGIDFCQLVMVVCFGCLSMLFVCSGEWGVFFVVCVWCFV